MSERYKSEAREIILILHQKYDGDYIKIAEHLALELAKIPDVYERRVKQD